MQIAGIVCGSLVAVVILVLVSLCVVKKWKLLSSYKTRRASSNPNNLLSFPCEHCEPPVADSDLNGLCEPSSIQCSQIVKRPPEIGEFVYMYMALTCFFVLQHFLCFIASRYCMFFILGNPVNLHGIFKGKSCWAVGYCEWFELLWPIRNRLFMCLWKFSVNREYFMESAGVRYLHTSCWRIRNRTSEIDKIR